MGKLSKLQAQQKLWQRGNLRFKLHKGQLKIDDAFKASKARLFVANCSRRLGKTYWALVKAIEVAMTCKLPNPRIFFASATKHDLKKFVLPAMAEVLVGCPDDLMPQWRPSEEIFRFPNGAEMHLLGLDERPDGIRGAYADLYIFEEAGQIDNLSYLYSSVVYPLLMTRPGSRIIMISTPSPTPAHPFKDFEERAKARNSAICLTIDDNPMLSAEEKAEALAECLTESERQREWYCKHVVDEHRAIVPEWDMNYERDVARPSDWDFVDCYTAMDLGTKIDLTAVLFGYYDAAMNAVIVEDERDINGPSMTTIALKDLVLDAEKKLWDEKKPLKRVSDSDNPLLIQDLGLLHKVHFTPTSKDNLHAMVNELRVLIKRGGLIVSPKCQKLIGCLRYGIWNKKRVAFDRTPLYGHFDHLAALIYMVRNIVFSARRLKPRSNDDSNRLIRRKTTEDYLQMAELKKLFTF